MRARSEDRANRQRQSIRPQKAHHGSGALQFPELGEDEMDAGLNLFIGIENDRARAVMGEPGGLRQPEFAACRLLTFSLMQSHANLVQFRFAHDAR